MRFLNDDGTTRPATPDDEEYLSRLREWGEAALEAEEMFPLDELEEHAQRLRERER
jgi:hypothetical protein